MLQENLKIQLNPFCEIKIAGEELDTGPRIKVISEFLEFELNRLNDVKLDSLGDKDPRMLNKIFIDTLVNINGDLI